jgi:sarcosine oxidase subunit gamma
MPVSVPERPGIAILRGAAEIIEVAALRHGAAAVARYAAACAEPLPPFGQVTLGAARLALCVRPARWLLVGPFTAHSPAPRAARWRAGCAGTAAVTELSSALAGFFLSGAALRPVLARGCRLDLDPERFAPGHAAATVMAQVSVTLAALPRGMLLLTAASTAQHFAEWLESTARPFGTAVAVQAEDFFPDVTAARRA